MKFKKFILWILAICFIINGNMYCNCANAYCLNSNYNVIANLCEKTLDKISQKYDAAISIAVMDNYKIVYSNGFGFANKENGTKVDEKTLFNIASISKIFTTAATMILVDEGTLDLTEKVITYLPEFKMADKRYKDITIKMLLDHSSGLGGIYDTDSGYAFNSDETHFLMETLKISSLSFEPGYANIYCNCGYTLLQIIIEKVTKKKFVDFLNEKIFVPLNLKNTWLSVGECKNKNIAKFYEYGTNTVYPNEVISDIASCGLSSTPTDLCIFSKLFCSNGFKLLSKASREKILNTELTPFFKLFNNNTNFGLGWGPIKIIKNEDGSQATILTKNGLVPHYTSVLTVVPEYGMAIAITMTNNVHENIDIESKILDILLNKKNINNCVASKLVKGENSVQDLKNYEGNYTDGYNMYNFSFSKKNDILTVSNFHEPEDKSVFRYDSSGYFKKIDNNNRNGEEDLYYFKVIDDTVYFSVFRQKWNGSIPYLSKIEERQNINLSDRIENKIWFRRNSKPFHQSQYLSSHIIFPYKYKHIPGYIKFAGINKIVSKNHASFSSILRDGNEFWLIKLGENVFINCNGVIYSSDNLCKKIQLGKNVINIGEELYSEWLIVDKKCYLSFEMPINARVAVFDLNGKLLYDSTIHKNGLLVKEKCYVECIGNEVNDKFIITTKT